MRFSTHSILLHNDRVKMSDTEDADVHINVRNAADQPQKMNVDVNAVQGGDRGPDVKIHTDAAKGRVIRVTSQPDEIAKKRQMLRSRMNRAPPIQQREKAPPPQPQRPPPRQQAYFDDANDLEGLQNPAKVRKIEMDYGDDEEDAWNPPPERHQHTERGGYQHDQYEAPQEPQPAEGFETLEEEKLQLSLQVSQLAQQQKTKVTPAADILQLRAQYRALNYNALVTTSIMTQRRVITSTAALLELANRFWKPLGSFVDLDDWSKSLALEINSGSYDPIFRRLHDKWAKRASFEPEWELAGCLVLSAVSFNISRLATRIGPAILNAIQNDPGLVKQVMQAVGGGGGSQEPTASTNTMPPAVGPHAPAQAQAQNPMGGFGQILTNLMPMVSNLSGMGMPPPQATRMPMHHVPASNVQVQDEDSSDDSDSGTDKSSTNSTKIETASVSNNGVKQVNVGNNRRGTKRKLGVSIAL